MIQQSQYWAYTEKTINQKDTCIPMHILDAALLQWPTCGSNLNVPQQRNGSRCDCAYIQWDITQP